MKLTELARYGGHHRRRRRRLAGRPPDQDGSSHRAAHGRRAVRGDRARRYRLPAIYI